MTSRFCSRRIVSISIWAAALSILSMGMSWAASTTVVISQVYGGGGNSGATYKKRFHRAA